MYDDDLTFRIPKMEVLTYVIKQYGYGLCKGKPTPFKLGHAKLVYNSKTRSGIQERMFILHTYICPIVRNVVSTGQHEDCDFFLHRPAPMRLG